MGLDITYLEKICQLLKKESHDLKINKYCYYNYSTFIFLKKNLNKYIYIF